MSEVVIRAEQGNLGDFLAKIRRERKLSLKDVERATEISASYINRLEKGNRGNPSLITLERLSTFYEISPQEIFNIAGLSPVEKSEVGSLNHLLSNSIKIDFEGKLIESELFRDAIRTILTCNVSDFNSVMEAVGQIKKLQE